LPKGFASIIDLVMKRVAQLRNEIGAKCVEADILSREWFYCQIIP